MSVETIGSDGVLEDALEPALVRRRFERAVDLVAGDLAVEHGDQVGDRAVLHRNAHRDAVELAQQIGQDQADRLGGPGRRRDDVGGGRPRAAQVGVRRVEDLLVVGVRVRGRHVPLLDPERVDQHLRQRGQAVGRARRVGDHVVLVGVVLVVVDADADGDVGAGRRGRDDDLAGTCLEVLCRTLALGEEPGRLDDDLDAEVAPGQRRGVALGQHLHVLAVDHELAVAGLDRARIAPVDRVVAQQVRKRRGAGEVVHRHDLEARIPASGGPKHVAADAAEPVDRNANAHPKSPLVVAIRRERSLPEERPGKSRGPVGGGKIGQQPMGSGQSREGCAATHRTVI